MQESRRLDHTGIDLTSIASVDLYRRNAFRLSGLPVDAAPRQIRRRANEIEAAERLGGEPPRIEDMLMRASPKPSAAEVLAALRRLRDPTVRILDEFFWLWPEPDRERPATLTGARNLWHRMLGGDDALDAAVGAHNLAIADHLRAVEGRYGTEHIAARWQTAYKRWRRVLAEEECWNWLARRVEATGDPQLKAGAVAAIRAGLPDALLGAHAQLAVSSGSTARTGKLVAAARKSRLGDDAIDRALTAAVQPEIARLRSLAEQATEAAGVREDYWEVCGPVLDGAKTGLTTLRAVLGDDHPTVSGVADKLATGIRHCVVAAVNRLGSDESTERRDDLRRAIDWLERAAKLGGGVATDRIDADTATITYNLVIACCNAALRKPARAHYHDPAAQRRLIEETREPLKRLRRLEADAHARLCDEVAGTSLVILVDFANGRIRSGADASTVLPALRGALELANDRQLRDQITKAIRDIEAVSRPAPEPFPRHSADPFAHLRGTEHGRLLEELGLADRFGQDPYGQSVPRSPHCVLCGAVARHTREVLMARLVPGAPRPDVHQLAVPCCHRCLRKRLGVTLLRIVKGLLFTAAFTLLALVMFMSSLALSDVSWWMFGMGVAILLIQFVQEHRQSRRSRLAEDPEVNVMLAGGWLIVR